MLINVFLSGIMITAFAMVAAKRITALINGFRLQSLFLFFLMFALAFRANSTELYIVTTLLFLIKVILIPGSLHGMVKKIKVNEDLGLFANPTISIFAAAALAYLAYIFTGMITGIPAFFVAISITLIGVFMMIFRMKALAQIVGLLVMENGMFLAAAGVSDGMPFIVEIAIFFDVFLAVIILGVFVYKINSLFTHIDVDKLTELKG